MQYIIALVLVIAGLFGMQPANAEVNASSVEASTTIEASKDASLPSYLTEVTTSPKPVEPQVEIPAQPAPEVGVPQPVEPAQPVEVCHEEDPCWDCSTMGNQICGPIAQPAQPVEPANPATCEEDMPCWDCATMGNLQCGPSASDEADALASYESQLGQPQIVDGMKLHYLGTVPVEPVHLNAGEFTLPDSNKFDTWHIYTWDVLTTV